MHYIIIPKLPTLYIMQLTVLSSIICLIHKTLHLLILITEFLQWCFYWELIRLPTLIVAPIVQSLDDYLLTNIWPVILVRHLLGTFRLLLTNITFVMEFFHWVWKIGKIFAWKLTWPQEIYNPITAMGFSAIFTF